MNGLQPQTRLITRRVPWRLRQARVTLLIVIANVVWYFFTLFAQTTGDTHGVPQGALSVSDVAYGRWYELVSSLFVHFGAAHIGLNMLSLVSLYAVELVLRSRPFLLLYLASGLVGNLVSLPFLSANDVSGGASGAVFGVFGAALALSQRGIFSKAARTQLLVLLVINLGIGLADPQIDLPAHVGGLIMGFGLAWGYRFWAKLAHFIIWSARLSVFVVILSMACTFIR